MNFYINLEELPFLPFRPETPTILIQDKQIVDDRGTLVTLEKNLKNKSFTTGQKTPLVALSGSNIILIKTQTSQELGYKKLEYNKKLESYVRPLLENLEETKKLEGQLEAALSIPRGGTDSLIGKVDLTKPNPGVTAPPFKSGVGARAKYNLRNKKAKAGNSILPGANAFTSPLQGKNTCINTSKGLDCRDSRSLQGKISHNLSQDSKNNRGLNSSSNTKKNQITKVEDQQQNEVIYSGKKTKIWARKQTTKIDKDVNTHPLKKLQQMEDSIDVTVQKPDKIVKAESSHFVKENKNLSTSSQNENNQLAVEDFRVYMKENVNDDKNFAVVVRDIDNQTVLAGPITDQEKANLEATNKLVLNDMARDPQTMVMNEKSIHEADAMKRAIQENPHEFKNMTVRRPETLSESNSDFLGFKSNGEKVQFEIVGFKGFGKQRLETQIQNTITHIKQDFKSDVKTVCDIATVPSFPHREFIYSRVRKELTPEEANATIFLVH